ncbi:MAG: hypothetical protein RJA22_3021 [Verrucomicrobiota bacterium]
MPGLRPDPRSPVTERPPTRVPKKDRTGAIISLAAHVGVILAVLFALSRTEMGKQMMDKLIGTTRDTKKTEDRPKPPPAQPRRQGPPRAASDAPPPSSGPRRAADAPPATGEGFFREERTQGKGESGPRGGGTNAPVRAAAPPVVKPLAKPFSFSAPKTDIKQLLAERAKSSAVVESFGTEQISKSGASDASDIIGRISGASLAEGKFAVVRGLADRYTLTTLNGADIPSADPNRRAVQLDLFPAQFISKVDVSKTFQPDLPGGFAGGALNIVTRSFPDKPLFTFSAGVSYNTQANLQDDYLFTDQGGRDWAAVDDGTRALPAEAAATSPRGDAGSLPIKSSFKSSQVSPLPGQSPLNQSYAFALGDTTYLFGRRLGFLGGFNYKQDYNFYEDGKVAKYDRQGAASWTKNDARSVIEYNWGSMATLAYELSPEHQLGFNFLYVQSAEDEARRLQGRDSSLTRPDQEADPSYIDQSILHWTERNLTYYQLQGRHEFPELFGIRLDWAGSMGSTSQDEPDHRIFQFFADYESDPENPFFLPDGPSQPSKPTRIFRSLAEDNTSFRLDWTIPLPSHNEQDNSLKTGFFLSQSEQTLFARTFEIRANGNHPFIYTGDPASFLAPSNYPYIDYRNFPANSEYTGQQDIRAYYGMGTYSPADWLRLVGGVRLESTDLSVETVNTGRGGVRSTSSINQDDILPALGATFTLRSNLQLRAAWSQTVVRPTYREISSAEIYDVAQGRTIYGNPDLTMSACENYDLRLEWYPQPGELVSIGTFMKRIEQAIELSARTLDNREVEYVNYDQADVFGIEVELRKEFPGLLGPGLDSFSLGFNYAFIKSVVDLTEQQKENRFLNYGETSTDRPLYDQPEFVVNGDLTWDFPAAGTSLTLNGGVTGRRLTLVGLATPDEYDEPAPYLDFSISQKLGRRWRVKFSAKNLLNPLVETTQTWPEVGRVATKSSTRGRSFGLSVSYDF